MTFIWKIDLFGLCLCLFLMEETPFLSSQPQYLMKNKAGKAVIDFGGMVVQTVEKDLPKNEVLEPR